MPYNLLSNPFLILKTYYFKATVPGVRDNVVDYKTLHYNLIINNTDRKIYLYYGVVLRRITVINNVYIAF